MNQGRRVFLIAAPAILALSASPLAFAQAQERARIAVSAVRVDPSVARTMPPSFSSNALTREIEAGLDGTQRFTVVSRSAASAEGRVDEQVVTGGGNVAAQRAQFLLTGEVLGMDLRQETRPVPNLAGKSSTRTVGRIQMQIEVERLGGTREIVSRFPIDAEITTNPVVHDTYNRPSGAETIGFVDLSRQVGLRIADRVRNEIYPVQVVTRTGGVVTLNRGEDAGYRVGERLRVFVAGERLIDPETNEDLGADEVEVGRIEITDLLPRVTRARIVSESGEIGRGNIVRR